MPIVSEKARNFKGFCNMLKSCCFFVTGMCLDTCVVCSSKSNKPVKRSPPFFRKDSTFAKEPCVQPSFPGF